MCLPVSSSYTNYFWPSVYLKRVPGRSSQSTSDVIGSVICNSLCMQRDKNHLFFYSSNVHGSFIREEGRKEKFNPKRSLKIDPQSAHKSAKILCFLQGMAVKYSGTKALYSHFRLKRNFGLHAQKTSGPESNRIDSHTLRIRMTRNRLTRNFGLYNCQIFPRRRSFRFVRRKITHSTIETDPSRAFIASSGGFAKGPYLLYNFSCVPYKFCRIWSIYEISGFSGV